MRCNKCHGETVGDQLQCDGCFMEDHSYPVAPGLCPDPIPDDIQDELTQLRARVKELESDSITHLGIIGEKEARIRELEEAMPLPCVLRAWAMDADAPAFYTAANGIGKPIRDLAERIEVVMKKSKEN